MNRKLKYAFIYAIVFSILSLLIRLLANNNLSITTVGIIGGLLGAIIGYSMSTIASNKQSREMMRMDKNSLNEYGILTALVSAAIFWQIAKRIAGESIIIEAMSLMAGWYFGYKLAKAVKKMLKK